MNGTKTRSGLLSAQGPQMPPFAYGDPGSYRVWMKSKAAKKTERRGHTLLGQFLLGTKNGMKA